VVGVWTPADLSLWSGRTDPGDAELRWHQVIGEPDDDASGTCLLGFASDLGVRLNQGRPGAAEGPDALRRALGNLPAPADSRLYDAGTVTVADDLAAGQHTYADRLAALLDAGHTVIGLGGGHEIAWGSFRGLARHLDSGGEPARIGIVNFDAHFDLREPLDGGTSGTPFRQIADDCGARGTGFHYLCLGVSEAANTGALFDFADAAGVRYLTDIDCSEERAAPLLEALVAEVDAVYVTVCLDALPAAVAPGVSAPAAFGLSLEFVIRCLRRLRAMSPERPWPVADVAELNPRYDVDGRTARTAARLVWELVG
jgi:formiminoglutamase